MLHTLNTKYSSPWEHIQQTNYGSSPQTDTSQLLNALDEGWQIQEVANYLAHGRNAESLGYLLTLYHPQRRLVREWNVDYSPGIEALLIMQAVPGYTNGIIPVLAWD